MDEERNKKIDEIEMTLKNIYKILKPTRWQAFTQGLWRAVGYLIGIILTIAIVGWVLNVIGLIPSMNEFSQDMKEILNIAKNK